MTSVIVDRRPDKGKSTGKPASRAEAAGRRAEGAGRQADRAQEAQGARQPRSRSASSARTSRNPASAWIPRPAPSGRVVPGNEHYRVGDKIPRDPSQGQGRGLGSGAGEGESDDEDAFRFALSREEYLSLLFDELELPPLVKKDLLEIDENRFRRGGVVRYGNSRNRLRRAHLQGVDRPARGRGSAARRGARGGRSGAQHRTGRCRAGAGAGRGTRTAGGAPARRRHPLPGSGRSAAPRSGRSAGAAHRGGDVLPHGRLIVHGRDAQGPGQALLHAAVSVPEPQVRRRWSWCSSGIPTRRRKSTKIPSSTARRPAAPKWCRRWSRCTRSSACAIPLRTTTSSARRRATATPSAPTPPTPPPICCRSCCRFRATSSMPRSATGRSMARPASGPPTATSSANTSTWRP